MFQSFMVPIESGTEVQYSNKHLETLDSIPSMRNFVSQKLNIAIHGAASCTWIIGFGIEDQRELIELYFKWFFDCETHYPLIPDNYQFIFNQNKNTVQVAELINEVFHLPSANGVYGFAEL